MSSKGNVLIVDDDEETRDLLKVQLKDHAFGVFFAGSAEEGMQLLDDEDIQVVMSDLHMPAVDGSHFLYQVRKKHPKTIRLVLSANNDPAEILSAVNAGHIYSFIQKPWKKESLIVSILNGLDILKVSKERDELLMRSHNLNTKLLGLNSELEEKFKQKDQTIEILNSNISKYIVQKELTLESLKEFLNAVFTQKNFTIYRYSDDSKMTLLEDSSEKGQPVSSLGHEQILKIVKINADDLQELLGLDYEPISWRLEGMNRADDYLLVTDAELKEYEDYLSLIRLLLSKLAE